MKEAKWNAFLFAVLLFFFLGRTVQAQIIQGAVIFGGNLTQVDGDEVYGFNRVGFNVGASAIIPINDHWSVSIEALYAQKGAYRGPLWKPIPPDTVDGRYSYRLNYAEIPILLHYNDKDVMTFGLGFSFGRLVSYTEYDNRMDVFNWVEYKANPAINNMEAIGDIRFRVYKNLKLNFRYSYSLFSFRDAVFHWEDLDHPEERQQYHNVISCRFIYIINEKQSKFTRKENKVFNDMQ